MKKLLFMLMGIVATINAMAVDYTAKAVLTLEATSGYTCEMTLKQAEEYGALQGIEMYMTGRKVALYALKDATPLQIAKAADFENLPLGLMCDASESYTITVSGVAGNETLKLFDLLNQEEYDLVDNAVINITATANATIADRFVINYVAPAPTCTTVRNNLVVDRYYTICLDKDVTSFSGASFWSMSKRGEGVAYLEEAVAPLTAGQPYIFQADAEELCVMFGENTAAAAGAAGALVGTFDAMNQGALDAAATAATSDIYLLYYNELWLANGQSGNNLPAYRAYVVYNELIPGNPQSAPGRRVRAIPMQANGATGFENIKASEAPAKMIIDGKMYILRGEQMFDATGRLVK